MAKLPKISNPYICGIILAMGGINMGMGIVYSSFTLTAITNHFKLSKSESTLFNCLAFFCAAIGSLGINPFVSRFGKRWVGFCCGIYGIIVWILLGLSQNKGMVFAFRALTGITIGLYSTICPTFLSEVAPVGKKFLFGFMSQLGICSGFLIVTILGVYLSWRYVSIICAFPSLVVTCGILFIPEPELPTIKVSVGKIFKYKKELFITFLLMFFLQFSGINAVMSNMQIILSNAHLSISSGLIGILTNIVQLISTIISAVVVDRLGNIICWTFSAAGQLIAFVLLCLHQKVNLPSAVFMIGLFLQQLSYGVGTGPIPFAASSNLFRVELKSLGQSFAGATNWILGGTVVFIFPYLEAALTLGYAFLFFVGIQVLSIIFGIITFRNKGEQQTNKDDEEESFDEEAANLSRKLSHAGTIPEL